MGEGNIYKGSVVKIDEITANISLPTGMVITGAAIPKSLLSEESINVGEEVAVVLFDDNTAIILTKVN